jgi:hypothetical protein
MKYAPPMTGFVMHGESERIPCRLQMSFNYLKIIYKIKKTQRFPAVSGKITDHMLTGRD